MKTEPAITDWHALPAGDALALLGASGDGLSDAEARARLHRHGPNRLPEAKPRGPILLFVKQFASPLIYLLLGAALVSLVIGALVDSLFILGVLMLNATIGAVQEARADADARALRSLIPQEARVRRGGGVRLVDSAEIVPGDVIELESGMRVTADMRLLDTSNLEIDESTLTGESLPVAKHACDRLGPQAALADRTTMAHAGSTVSEGRATGLVVATGEQTALGMIGRTLGLAGRAGAEPPLVRRMTRLSRQIAIASVMVIALLSLLLWIDGEPWRAIFLLAVALAVSAIPEGLPIAVTVALSAATRRMAKRNVIVRALPAVEGLGACTVIASDKTGTLTANRLSVERGLVADHDDYPREAWRGGAVTGDIAALGFAAAVCNEARLSAGGEPVGDTVDVALLDFAREVGVDIDKVLALPRETVTAYEPVLRYAATALATDDTRRLYVKGAAETVLAMCADPPASLAARAEALAGGGYRMLALAEGELPRPGERPAGLRLLGFVGLFDPLRPEVPDAVARCARAGIGVVMVTGDHPVTARAIAEQLGMECAPGQVVTGAELSRLADTPELLAERVVSGRVFARIEPIQKLRIVRILGQAGEIVAVTGDGVNDAPALKAADIGVAMGLNGTDVARGAADLILADDNFASIVAGIEEGRVTFANIRKIVIFVLACGLSEIGMFLGAMAVGLPMPLTAVQLLWHNVVTNGVQDVMLGFGRGEGDELDQPPRRKLRSLIDRDALILMLPSALAMALLALWILDRQLASGATIEEARNVVLFSTVLFQNGFILVLRHLRHPFWHWQPPENRWLFGGVALALSIQAWVMLFAPMQTVLGTSPVDPMVIAIAIAGSLLVASVTEMSKFAVRRPSRVVACRSL